MASVVICVGCAVSMMMVDGLMLGWLRKGIPVGVSSGGWAPVWSFLHKTSQPLEMIVHTKCSFTLS